MKLGLKNAIKRAEKGGFKEYWLQLYIKENYKKLGFESIEGPFEIGYDFKGVYKGKEVVVEVERTPQNFVEHGHDPKEVDLLIVLGDDNTNRSLLPRKIIKVNPEDFVKETHEMRKNYAIKKEEEEKWLVGVVLPFSCIKSALSTLWHFLVEEVPLEGTPEAEAFDEALDNVTFAYIKCYDIDLKKMSEKNIFTKIDILANDLVKSHREFTKFTKEEKRFVIKWLSFLHEEYTSRL